MKKSILLLALSASISLHGQAIAPGDENKKYKDEVCQILSNDPTKKELLYNAVELMNIAYKNSLIGTTVGIGAGIATYQLLGLLTESFFGKTVSLIASLGIGAFLVKKTSHELLRLDLANALSNKMSGAKNLDDSEAIVYYFYLKNK